MEVSMTTRENTTPTPMRMGMVLFLISETFLFGSLFWTYYYLRATTTAWPPEHPSATLASINTFFLLASSYAIWLGTRAIRKGNEHGLLWGLIITIFLGCSFIGLTVWEWTHEAFKPWTNAYGSTFFTLTGFHALHVFIGILLMLALLIRTGRHRFTSTSFVAVETGSLYWHFVDFIWILVFITLFIIR
jgi:heme/copper-type cytochrome/quinol oxidase subunit 3